MQPSDETRMGGEAGRTFLTTQWTRIADAKEADGDRRRAAAGVIVEQYWKPVYHFLRRKGHTNEQAKDLTQGFFCDVFLGRDLLERADQAKGRFRALLLSSLERYLIGQHRSASARKRTPTSATISLEGLGTDDDEGPLELADHATPAAAFAYAWAASLVGRVLAEVADSCVRDGLTRHWEVFKATVVGPALEGAAPASLNDLCRSLDIESEVRASNMSITVKRRFQATLRAAVRQYVEDDSQVDDEIRDLMDILNGGGGGR